MHEKELTTFFFSPNFFFAFAGGPPPPKEAPPPPGAPPPDDDDIGADAPPPPPDGAPPPDDEMTGGPPPPPPPDEEDEPPPPPPPEEEEKKKIQPMMGRLRVVLLEARDIGATNQYGQKQEGAKVDPYVKLQLGSFKKAPSLKSKVQKRQRAAFSLGNEVLHFDIFDPSKYVALSASGDGSEEIPLTVGIWDSNRFADDLLGEVTLSILDFMEMEDDHYGVLNSNRSVDWWPLSYATKNGVIPAGEVRLQIEFLPAAEGMLVITAYEGRNLKNMELIGKQDPYCKYTLGKKLKKRTRTVKKGGTNPFFNEEEVEFWIGPTDWGHPLVFSCLDEDVGSDDLIGGRRFSLMPFFTQTEPTHDWFEISNKGKPTGEVQLRFEFFPAGRLKIQCHAGRNLIDKDSMGRQDPYCLFKLDTDLVEIHRKTKTDTDGGTEPLWEQTLYMPIVHQVSHDAILALM